MEERGCPAIGEWLNRLLYPSKEQGLITKTNFIFYQLTG
jgi:hypothetical protein